MNKVLESTKNTIVSIMAIWGVALIASSCFGRLQMQDNLDSKHSCLEFIKNVYKSKHTIQNRQSSMSPELFRLLQDDYDAQSQNPGDVAGLDFDPFDGAQDTCDSHAFEEPTSVEGDYQVPIFCIVSGKKGEKPDVVPQIRRVNGQWQIVNFRYPALHDSDLLTILKNLRSARAKAAKQSTVNNVQPANKVPVATPSSK